MKAAVIGANSYIARNFIRVNELYGYADAALYDCGDEQFDHAAGYRKMDAGRQEEVEQAVADCDLIYFFIGKVGTVQGFNTPDVFLDVNEKLLFRLLNACRAVGTKAKIVFPSTRLVYRGNEASVKEDARKQFLTPYAMQKYACEQYLEMYHRVYGLNYCALRIGVPYGTLVRPVSSYGTLDFFLRQAAERREISIYGDGKQRRTFTCISDLSHILWRAGLCPDCVNDVYNVGGEVLSIREAAEMVAAATQSAVLTKPWPEDALKVESGSTVFDSEKLDRLLGYKAEMTIKQWITEGMKMEKQYMRDKFNIDEHRKRGGGSA